jgi:hypothetical protein
MREMEGCKTGVERRKLGRVRGNKNEEGWDNRIGKDTESPELALDFIHTAHHHAQFCLSSPYAGKRDSWTILVHAFGLSFRFR